MTGSLFGEIAIDSHISNENFGTAYPAVSAYGPCFTEGAWGENGGCVFMVGHDVYFVPTQPMADDGMLYIACDAQKIDGPVARARSMLALGAIAESRVVDAILDHLSITRQTQKQGEAFVVTSSGKTFRL